MTVRIGVSYIDNSQSGRNYLAALRMVGAEPVVLADEATLPRWPTAEQAKDVLDLANPAVTRLDDLDGLLLTGGGDIDPMLYREVIAGSHPPNWPRDHVETAQFHRARARNLPILGICRGHQFVNVAMGGSLVQDVALADSDHAAKGKVSAAHLVRIAGDSVLARIIADGKAAGDLVVGVNSRHHQGVSPERLAPGLVAVGSSCAEPVGATVLIEGFESEATRAGTEYVVGVQWHPERVDDVAPIGSAQPVPFREISLRLFQAFVNAAEAARSGNQLRELVALKV